MRYQLARHPALSGREIMAMTRIMAIGAALLAGIAMMAASDGTAHASPHVETIHDVTVEA